MTTRDPNDRHGDAEAEGWSYGTLVERPLDGGAALGPSTSEPEQHGAPSDEQARSQPAPPAGDPEADRDARHKEHAPSDDRGTEGRTEDEPPPPAPRKTLFVIAGLVLVALLAWGAYSHWRIRSDASDTQANTANAVPEVRVVDVKRDDTPIALSLPGQTEAFATASIYPRATGYITVRNVDIGSRVKKGDLLVHITAPDLDQQLAQAKAQLGQLEAAETQSTAQVNQAEANLNLAKVTLARTATLTQQGYETLQNRDNQIANQESQQANLETAKAGVKVAQANTRAQQAAVDRLAALAGFEDVVAPFNGVVTTRNVDLGDLVNADTASATAMFSMAQDDTIRVTVQVPQNASAGVTDGVPASVEVPSNPGQTFGGTVTRSSVALLSSARTLDTEVDVPNPDGRIRPGLFVYVTLHIPRTHPQIQVPAEALIFNQDGLQVVTADGDKAKLHKVKIDRDFGTSVSLSEGLEGGEQVILSPPSLIRDGTRIKPVKAEDTQQPDVGGAAPAKGTDDGKKTDPAGDAAKAKAGQQG